MNQLNRPRRVIDLTILAILSTLAIVYLIAVPLGYIQSRLGPVEAAIFAVLVLIYTGFLRRISGFAVSEKGLEVRLHEVQEEQKRQKVEVDGLRFLITQFLPVYEQRHLAKLASGEPFPYRRSPSFDKELRSLRALGLIQGLPGVTVSQLPVEGDLRASFVVTERGREYLALRRQIDEQSVPQQ